MIPRRSGSSGRSPASGVSSVSRCSTRSTKSSASPASKTFSYARLVKSQKASAGKVTGTSGAKIGNAHLKWAFSEAAVLFLQKNPRGQRLMGRLRSKHGKGKALSVLAARLGRASYFMLSRSTPFDMDRFLN
jgi:transposase